MSRNVWGFEMNIPTVDQLLERNRELEAALVESNIELAAAKALLDRIGEVSDQPFTETHEHLPGWIETILKTRLDYAKRQWDEAQRELHAVHDNR
jgi:hypothetical protein